MKRTRLAAAIGAIGLALPGGAGAQIVLDGSILPDGSPLQPGTALPLQPGGLEFQITDEHGRFSANGESRYHSFSQFDLFNPNQVAVFSSLATPERVIVRVTQPSCCGYGGSAIFGKIASTIPNADLYFLNPFGIVMDGARIEVGGSFYASTANVLRFGEDAAFPTGEATPPAALSAAPPSAFGFTGPELPAPITVSAQLLAVPPGKTLSFVGGSVEFTGRSSGGSTVAAPDATVQIGAAAGPVDLPVDLSGVDLAALPAAPTSNLAPGAVWVHRDSAIDVGSDAKPIASGVGVGDPPPAGAILIRGGRFVIDDARLSAVNRAAADATGAIDIGVNGAISITNGARVESASDALSKGGAASDVLLGANSSVGVSNGGRVVSEARGAGAGGAIAIDTDALSISNSNGSLEGSFVSSVAGIGAGGDVDVSARHVELTSGGQLRAETAGAGDAGRLQLTGADTVRLSGIDPRSGEVRPSGLTSLAQESATGSGGTLTVATRILAVDDGAQISARTDGEGSAGDISIAASESVSIRGGANGFSSVSATSTKDAALEGRSGNLTIEVPDVVLADGGSVSVSTAGASNAGTLTIRAANVSISGVDPKVGNESGVFAQQISVNGSGAGGNIAIETSGDIGIADRGLVSVLTRGAGGAGTIHLAADGAIRLTSGGRVAAETAGDGSGGRIELDAGRGVSISEGASISAQATRAGRAGDIDVDAGPRLELVGAAITTEARRASGGRVVLTARDAVVLQDARITTSVFDGTGGGGDVTIDPQFVILDRSEIRANADEGAGGNIRIAADTFLASPDSVLDASSQLGIDGTVVIDSPNPELTGKLAALPQNFLNSSELLADPCLARTETEGSFVVQPRAARTPPDAPLAPDSGEPLSCSTQEETR